jgi:hypothetical protein
LLTRGDDGRGPFWKETEPSAVYGEEFSSLYADDVEEKVDTSLGLRML